MTAEGGSTVRQVKRRWNLKRRLRAHADRNWKGTGMRTVDVINLLWRTGHFRNPEMTAGATWKVSSLAEARKLTIYCPAFAEAVGSYQDFHADLFDSLAMEIHKRPANHDWQMGAATKRLLELPRCGEPDYEADGVPSNAKGTKRTADNGSWPANCHPEQPYPHALTVSIDFSQQPPFLRGKVFEEIWEAVFYSYSEIGLVLVRTDGDCNANIQFSWKKLGGSTAGLAVTPRGIHLRCSSSIWCRFSSGYEPSDLVGQWITLVKHGIGHTIGLCHTRSGVMSPIIRPNLPVSWKHDPSMPLLRHWFGGEPAKPSRVNPGS